MRKPEFYAAMYAIIKNENGEVLFMKRKNTGFRDGNFQVPAGHLEGKETLKQGFIREKIIEQILFYYLYGKDNQLF